MTDEIHIQWPPAEPHRLAAQFTRVGWIGFFIQLALLAIPVLLAVFALLPITARSGLGFMDILSYGSLLVMIFTTYWFFRYTRLGNAMGDASPFPSKLSVINTLWVGMWVSFVGILFSMVLLFSSSSGLLFTLLANPQTGLMVAPAIGDSAQSISALDVIGLNSLLITLLAELVVIGMTLWLLFKTIRPTTAKA